MRLSYVKCNDAWPDIALRLASSEMDPATILIDEPLWRLSTLRGSTLRILANQSKGLGANRGDRPRVLEIGLMGQEKVADRLWIGLRGRLGR